MAARDGPGTLVSNDPDVRDEESQEEPLLSGRTSDYCGRPGGTPGRAFAAVFVAAMLLVGVVVAASKRQSAAATSSRGAAGRGVFEFHVLEEEKEDKEGEKEKEKKKTTTVTTATTTTTLEPWRLHPDPDMLYQASQMKHALKEQSEHADAEIKLAAKQQVEEAKRVVREQKEAEAQAKKEASERAKKEAEEKKAKAEEEKAKKLAAEKKELAAAKKAKEAEEEKEKKHGGESIFVMALDDLLQDPTTPPVPTTTTTTTTRPLRPIHPLPPRGKHGFFVLSAKGACAGDGMFPISHTAFCERAAKTLGLKDVNASVTNEDERPEGCYVHNAKTLWVATNPHNKGRGSFNSTLDVRQQICMSKDQFAEEAKLLEEEAERAAYLKRKAAAVKALKVWQHDEKTVPNVSLYCFSLMRPYGYEPNLLKEQQQRKVGIFACDEAVVFSNETTLEDGTPSPVEVAVVEGSLEAPLGGKWMTALNTGVFNRIWMKVIQMGRYRYHDWVVKVDPDAVFFPSRLSQLLRHRTPYNDDEVTRHVKEPAHLQCGSCKMKGKEHETCAAHVRAQQKQGRTCKQALDVVARPAPTGCGCECDDFACDLPGSSMYLNNCQWGLHGPIEVLSRRAVATYWSGLPQCAPLLEHAWGEDKFLDKCLQQLGVERVNEYSLLSEVACGETPAPCSTSKVAFHPFKSIQSYFTCFEYANTYATGPAAPPSLDVGTEEEDAAGERVVMK